MWPGFSASWSGEWSMSWTTQEVCGCHWTAHAEHGDTGWHSKRATSSIHIKWRMCQSLYLLFQSPQEISATESLVRGKRKAAITRIQVSVWQPITSHEPYTGCNYCEKGRRQNGILYACHEQSLQEILRKARQQQKGKATQHNSVFFQRKIGCLVYLMWIVHWQGKSMSPITTLTIMHRVISCHVMCTGPTRESRWTDKQTGWL